jgi:hypothetical protein
MGNVYNDYLADGDRQPDAPTIRGVRLKLAGENTAREVTVDASGDYEFDQLARGDYQLSVDPSTIPPSFVAATDSYPLHLAAASTVTHDIPLRALRSISGTIVFAPGDAASATKARELAGVRLAVGSVVTASDANGNFLLRNLPAGRLTVQVLAASAVPTGLKLPAGEVELPREPTTIRDAKIVISNPDLLPYIQPSAPRHTGSGAGSSSTAPSPAGNLR